VIQREEADEDTELVDMTRRFWVAVALSVPVLLLAMLPMLGVTLGIPQNVSRWAQLALSTPVVLWAGWPFFARGWRSFVTWHLSMFTLFPCGRPPILRAQYCHQPHNIRRGIP
jgi:Cu+-exporting ATPase